jgi:hypothetical protein
MVDQRASDTHSGSKGGYDALFYTHDRAGRGIHFVPRDTRSGQTLACSWVGVARRDCLALRVLNDQEPQVGCKPK